MIKSTFSGAEALKKELKNMMEQFDAPIVTVGIHEDAADPPEGEISMAHLGAVHEFGAGNVPQRPWLQPGFDSGVDEYKKIMEDGVAAAAEGTGDLKQAMNQVGLVAVGKVQQYMTELKSPANAKSTVRRKKSANPLIDEGNLKGAVAHKLQSQIPQEGL